MQRSAAIVSKIDDQTIDPFFYKAIYQFTHILGGAAIIRVALLLAFEVEIKRGDVDYTNPPGGLAFVDGNHAGLCGLLLKLDRIAHDGDDFGFTDLFIGIAYR